MTSTLAVGKCKKGLARVWFSGAGLVFVIVLLQSLFGRYAGHLADAWGWFLPAVMPTLSLMIGVFVADALAGGRPERYVDAFVYRLALGLSLGYFAVVLATLLLQPFTGVAPLELLGTSQLWLAPLQSLVTAVLGAFFVKAGQGGQVADG